MLHVDLQSDPWKEIGVPVLLALLGATVAAFWPWIQSFQRGRRFERLIRRELAEMDPYPRQYVPDRPWWQHARTGFVHQELFRRDSISQNRDFLLGLDPTVVYQVSQLWAALEDRDGNQWLGFLRELGDSKRVGSEGLRSAAGLWAAILERQREERNDWLEPTGSPSTFRRESALARVPDLFQARLASYGRLLPLTDYGPADAPKDLTPAERRDLDEKLRAWFYDGGAGLLLSGRSHERFTRVRALLRGDSSANEDIRSELSRLRTDLKIDLGVRQPRERDENLAWPDDERW